jgi:hypothetical protein
MSAEFCNPEISRPKQNGRLSPAKPMTDARVSRIQMWPTGSRERLLSVTPAVAAFSDSSKSCVSDTAKRRVSER